MSSPTPRSATTGPSSEMVREFHEKHGFDLDVKLELVGTRRVGDLATDQPHRVSPAVSLEHNRILKHCGETLKRLSKWIERGTSSPEIKSNEQNQYDVRLMRAHLMLEELSEVMFALEEQRSVDLLDGLADLRYVTDGTAATFGLPLEEAFDEVHASNMSKSTAAELGRMTMDDPRLRNKGPNFRRPDLLKVIDDHQRAKASSAAPTE